MAETLDFNATATPSASSYTADDIEVLEGLEVGERIVTSSYDTFGDVDRLVLEE